MNEKELIDFLKENMKLNLDYDGYDSSGDNYKISINIKGEEICCHSFSIYYDNGGFGC